MAKSTIGGLGEWLITGFGVFDFLLPKGKGAYKPQTRSAPARSSGYRMPQQKTFGSGQGSTTPKKKKKPSMSNYSREGLGLMMSNSIKIKESYSGLKTDYKPKKNKIFSGL